MGNGSLSEQELLAKVRKGIKKKKPTRKLRLKICTEVLEPRLAAEAAQGGVDTEEEAPEPHPSSDLLPHQPQT